MQIQPLSLSALRSPVPLKTPARTTFGGYEDSPMDRQILDYMNNVIIDLHGGVESLVATKMDEGRRLGIRMALKKGGVLDLTFTNSPVQFLAEVKVQFPTQSVQQQLPNTGKPQPSASPARSTQSAKQNMETVEWSYNKNTRQEEVRLLNVTEYGGILTSSSSEVKERARTLFSHLEQAYWPRVRDKNFPPNFRAFIQTLPTP